MELQHYFMIIKKRLALIITIPMTFAIFAALYTHFMMKPMYAATTTVIIGKDDNSASDKQNAYASYSELMMYDMLVKTYEELTKSTTVADTVIRNLNLDILPRNLTSMISTSSSKETEMFSITVRSGDPRMSMNIANETAKAVKQKSIELTMGDNISILDEATLPGGPYGPNLRRNVYIAFALGFMLSIGLVFLLEFLDNTVKSREDAEAITGMPIIGVIPLISK